MQILEYDGKNFEVAQIYRSFIIKPMLVVINSSSRASDYST